MNMSMLEKFFSVRCAGRRDLFEGLEDTAEAALKQIEEKKYESLLIEKGIPRERIRKYGFAFRGKEILIGGGR